MYKKNMIYLITVRTIRYIMFMLYMFSAESERHLMTFYQTFVYLLCGTCCVVGLVRVRAGRAGGQGAGKESAEVKYQCCHCKTESDMLSEFGSKRFVYENGDGEMKRIYLCYRCQRALVGYIGGAIAEFLGEEIVHWREGRNGFVAVLI